MKVGARVLIVKSSGDFYRRTGLSLHLLASLTLLFSALKLLKDESIACIVASPKWSMCHD